MKKVLFSSSTLLYSHMALGEITQISNLNPIISVIPELCRNDLVIFDVGDVLIRKKDLILNSIHKDYNDHFANEILTRNSREDSEKLWSTSLLSAKNELIDLKIVNIIKMIQEKNIKMLALTSAIAGKFGHISSLEDWNIDRLSYYNIHFSKSWSKVSSKKFTNFIPKEAGRYPMFKNGIIFTSGMSKGEVLKQFLIYANYKPNRIIFIDDKLRNLKSVESFCLQENINFIGFEYIASKIKSQKKLNTERAKFQYTYLEKEHKWLSDREADQKLKEGNQ